MCACPCPCPQGVSMYARKAMREKTFVEWAVPLWAVGSSLICVGEMQSHGRNGYMEPFTFTDTDTDKRTCRHNFTLGAVPFRRRYSDFYTQHFLAFSLRFAKILISYYLLLLMSYIVSFSTVLLFVFQYWKPLLDLHRLYIVLSSRWWSEAFIASSICSVFMH